MFEIKKIMILAALVQHPLAGALTVLIWPERNPLKHLTLSSYLFASAFAAAPYLVLFALRRRPREGSPIERGFEVAAVLAIFLSLAGQLIAWRGLHTDAQAALTFVFLPIYITLITAPLYLVLRWVLRKP